MKKILLIAAMALFTLTASAQAKFAYVDFNELVMLAPEADAARSQMQAAQKEAQETLQSMMEEAQTKYNEYQQKQSTWTPAIKSSKEKELGEIQNRIQEFQQSIQAELQQQQQQLMDPIYKKAQEAVEKLAKAGGYLFVFETSQYLYVDKAQCKDLTPEARKAMNIPEDRTIEDLQKELQALQCATSHNFGADFAKAFNVQFLDKDNQLKPVYETSWGMTTRMIGALIMVHGDDSGLKLPPRIAPTQICIVPIQQKKEGVLEKAYELRDQLRKSGFRVKVDDGDKSPGFKFADCEVRGIPLRIEVGPKDIEAGHAVLVRRDTREKIQVSFDELAEETGKLLEQIQQDMYDRAKTFLEEHTSSATNMDELVDIVNTKRGFVKAMWCGCRECEDKLKEMSGITSRCIPFEQESISDTCVVCGKPATKMVYWGRAY